jgi:hypothetical protein
MVPASSVGIEDMSAAEIFLINDAEVPSMDGHGHVQLIDSSLKLETVDG